jgi:predicted CoA-substrate-specific enzyme activase
VASTKNYYAGCDVGSTTGKAVILNDNEIISTAIIQAEIDPEVTAKIVLEKACRNLDGFTEIVNLAYLVGTGYGRSEIPFADENISEISCHALGVFHCNPEIKTIVDIGGQDVKGISINSDGSVLEFVMNDKCAAGTGRFLEMMSKIFRMDLNAFSALSLQAKKTIPVTSQCSVFAETEVISLLSKRKPPADIAAGIQAAVAKRSFTLLKKVGVRPEITVTGGCAKNEGLLKALQDRLRMKITPLSIDPQLMGALGAAIFARRKVS